MVSVLHVVISVCIWSSAIWSPEKQLPIMLPILFFVLNLKKKISTHKCDGCFQLGKLNDHLFGKELCIRVTVRAFSERLSVYRINPIMRSFLNFHRKLVTYYNIFMLNTHARIH